MLTFSAKETTSTYMYNLCHCHFRLFFYESFIAFSHFLGDVRTLGWELKVNEGAGLPI